MCRKLREISSFPRESRDSGLEPRLVKGYIVISSRPRSETITNSIGMKLTLIPAGEFWMGSPDEDKTVPNHEKPRHKVVLTKPFYIGVYEVTRGEILEVL